MYSDLSRAVVVTMPSFLQRVEALLGRSLVSIRGHDTKLFVRTPAFTDHPEPTLSVASPECGASMSELQIHHTPLGENRFPQLQWEPPSSAKQIGPTEIAEYLIVVEDPDAPLPMPVVHGIYYAIPPSKTLLLPEDFDFVSDDKKSVHGGFKFGSNRMKSVWGGPKPVLGHGLHRYMFQVVGLGSSIEQTFASDIPTRSELERAVEGKVVGWGMWVGTYERKLA